MALFKPINQDKSQIITCYYCNDQVDFFEVVMQKRMCYHCMNELREGFRNILQKKDNKQENK